jgi:hypothetical protein
MVKLRCPTKSTLDTVSVVIRGVKVTASPPVALSSRELRSSELGGRHFEGRAIRHSLALPCSPSTRLADHYIPALWRKLEKDSSGRRVSRKERGAETFTNSLRSRYTAWYTINLQHEADASGSKLQLKGWRPSSLMGLP